MSKPLPAALLDAPLPKKPMPSPYRGLRSAFKHAAAYAAGYLAYCRDGCTAAARYEELSRLSNAELARRGLTRYDISRLIFKELVQRWAARG